MDNRPSKIGWILLGGCGLVLCCLMLAAGGALVGRLAPLWSGWPFGSPTATPVLIRPTPGQGTGTPGAQNAAQVNPETLANLQNAQVPAADLVGLAESYKGLTDIPATFAPPAVPLQVGDQQKFWLSNEDENRSFQVESTLQYIGKHAYFWVENGVKYDPAALKDLMDTFDDKIYPTDREFFGSEWTPGIDGDPRIYILYARHLGREIAGYFSSSDELPPQAHEYSNAHEMFDVNADVGSLDDVYTRLVLAHEFQHMIHWYRDRNEETWMNEGFSELAAFLNGFYRSGFDLLYAQNPDIQLNTWPDAADTDQSPHYGSSFLFLAYFLDRFGETATQALVADPENGLPSIDHVLKTLDERDALTRQPLGADDVFLDWVITNYLHDPGVLDGRFAYRRYTSAPQVGATQKFSNCPVSPQVNTVHQYGVDYIEFDCRGTYHLRFDGSIQTSVVPASPHSGSYMFWSNRSDQLDSTLTHSFDFRGVSGRLTLDFWTWYDLENGYDFDYISASQDGHHWTSLHTPSGTDHNPSGSNYGWGYTGKSGGNPPGWIHEQVDLSQYAGKQVELRFENITDTAVNRDGFLLDDLSIPEIGYATDFEQDSGGWQAAGWVRINNILPQTWRLALIEAGSSQTRVTYLQLNPDLSLDVPVEIGDDFSHVTLVVTATTRFTTQTTSYRYWMEP